MLDEFLVSACVAAATLLSSFAISVVLAFRLSEEASLSGAMRFAKVCALLGVFGLVCLGRGASSLVCPHIVTELSRRVWRTWKVWPREAFGLLPVEVHAYRNV